MIDEFAVKFAIEYLDRSFANGEQADLVGMLNHVDYFERAVMDREEVLQALKQRPSVSIQRVDGRIIFDQSSGDQEITEEELQRCETLGEDPACPYRGQVVDGGSPCRLIMQPDKDGRNFNKDFEQQ
jgi:hypothetical protein